MVARIGIRFYRGDSRRHVYDAADLAETRWRLLAPVCQDWLYPLRHPSDKLDPTQCRTLGGAFLRCEPCAVWLDITDHILIVDDETIAIINGDVVTVGGLLPQGGPRPHLIVSEAGGPDSSG